MDKVWRCRCVSFAAVMIMGCGGAEKPAGDGAVNSTPPAAGATQGTESRAPDPSGETRFVAVEEPSITLTLRESAAGGVTGTLSEGNESMPLIGRRAGAGFTGRVGPRGNEMPFTATESGGRVVLVIGDQGAAQRLTFTRAAASKAAPAADAAGDRNVVINDRRLTDEEVARAEQQYRVRIPDADYWYDRTLGAWGAKGGPTMGFISPGLELGGALRPNASNGNTNVFVNGRELPALDLAALQQITGPIPPGRYFITAQGLAGYEGGAPQWNLAELAAQNSGGSNTWQSRITGASGFSDGTTGAVFLPNGGIVSTGN